ncbi:hypothetical protein C8R41DRAFT_449092 [Lentinula lateritia]|uniref:Uncharacterized protein n=1 Tax=Lentinula lateritia TaxID=40482 RepID=A0ABQ8VAM8_9AGAR|nr:hypothetical protein C8R41DRAFT_449092 [Lentinula lateritia]
MRYVTQFQFVVLSPTCLASEGESAYVGRKDSPLRIFKHLIDLLIPSTWGENTNTHDVPAVLRDLTHSLLKSRYETPI